MKLPEDATIPTEKLTKYLLVPRQRNDKSGFLAQAGFRLGNWHLLEAAIRQLLIECEAIQDRHNEYGMFYRVEGELRGPTGTLLVVTVWLRQAGSSDYRFVTLKPAR